MNSNRRIFRDRRGTIGIEAAIVLIAFVVVASAVAYVIINMGFYAAQKSKETIGRGVDSASSSLELDGSVIGRVNKTGVCVEYLIIPVRLSVGKSQVDLSNQTVMISVFANNFTLADIYIGELEHEVKNEYEEKYGNYIRGEDPQLEDVIKFLNGTFREEGRLKDVAVSVVYNDDGDSVLELNEKAFIVIQLNSTGHTLKSYDVFKVEIKPGTGAALTIVRQVPPGLLNESYVDLG